MADRRDAAAGARSGLPLPTHRYVPGLTARHAEGAFDAIRELAPVPTTSERANANIAWLHGLDLIEAGYHWEAHEILEPVWMAAPDRSPERAMVQALIQLANAALKQRMERENAARRLCAIARGLLADAGDPGALVMGLRIATVSGAIDALEASLTTGTLAQVRLTPDSPTR